MLDEARAARDAAIAERAAIADEAARQAAARADALTQAATEAATEKERLLAAAHDEAERKRLAAEAALEIARRDEAAAAGDRASQLALDIAAKLLDRLPAETRVAGFIDGLAAQLASLPEATRADFAAEGEARLKAPRALTPAELQACDAALARALGRPVRFSVEIDPGLIAGLEIETRHAQVRNSFRADLERIATELTRHESAGK
jgi:F-type H+-transporting ATPase subunit b